LVDAEQSRAVFQVVGVDSNVVVVVARVVEVTFPTVVDVVVVARVVGGDGRRGTVVAIVAGIVVDAAIVVEVDAVVDVGAVVETAGAVVVVVFVVVGATGFECTVAVGSDFW
jgi:hypothetical protein